MIHGYFILIKAYNCCNNIISKKFVVVTTLTVKIQRKQKRNKEIIAYCKHIYGNEQECKQKIQILKESHDYDDRFLRHKQYSSNNP